MRKVFTLVPAAALLFVVACDEATEPELVTAEQPAFGFTVVPGGEFVDPNTQKIKAELVVVANPDQEPPPPGASARAIFNDVSGAEKVIIQVNAWGLHPNTDYEFLTTEHGQGPVNAGVAYFTTDEYGDGGVHVSYPFGELQPFNKVNIRKADVSGSRQLHSYWGDGGVLYAN